MTGADTTTVLLTGTRAPATLDLARRLNRAGVRLIGADSMRFPLGRFSRAFAAHHRVPPPRQQGEAFADAIARIVEQEKVNCIVPTCEEVFYLARYRERIPVPLLCPDLEVLELLHHKREFALWTQGLACEVKAPETWAAESAPEEVPLIWKPDYSRFAAKLRTSPPTDPSGWTAQRRVSGREFCSWAWCVQGKVVTMAQYECPVRSGKGAGCAFTPIWHEPAHQFTREVAERLRCTGSLGFDFMHSNDDGRIYVLECNPRLTSGLHLLPEDFSWSCIPQPGEMKTRPELHAAQLWLPVLLTSPLHARLRQDVVGKKGDMLPALGQLLTAGEFIGRAMRNRCSLQEATTLDIEYNGDR